MAPSEHDLCKELTRKLYWAITSTITGLDRAGKATSFTWAADMAERIIARTHPSHPPPVDSGRSNGYTGLADGRGGGRVKPSLPRFSRSQPPPNQAVWEQQQAAMREKAWAYVMASRQNGSSWRHSGGMRKE